MRKFAPGNRLLLRNNGIKIAIILLTLVCSCNSERRKRLSEKEMATVIAELKLLEAKVDHFYLRNTDSSKVAFHYLQQQVFKKNNTDSATYYKSYEYYLSRKKRLVKILEDASKQLENSEEDRLRKMPELE